jgi:hypothetical protein
MTVPRGRAVKNPSRPNYRTTLIDSWKDFLKALQPLSHHAFRGQCDSSRPLLTSLSRHLLDFNVKPNVWRSQELRILRIFKRKAHNYLHHIPQAHDDFEWLALMEHHGSPTRLLDLTWSPYVAAFFALQTATKEAAVWALDPAAIVSSQTNIARPLRIRKFESIDPRIRGNYPRFFLNGTKPFVWIGEPDVMNRRLTAQSGTFIVPSVLDRPIDQIIGASEAGRNAIVKLVLSTRKMRDEAMRELYSMNITSATLFPDLDGLARSLAYELEFHWAFNPHTGQNSSS